MEESLSSFSVNIFYQGKTVVLSDITVSTSGGDLYNLARENIGHNNDDAIKLLYKGKQLQRNSEMPVFAKIPKKAPKIIVLATSKNQISDIQQKRSDPTIRGFSQERNNDKSNSQNILHWGPNTGQDKSFKFCRFQTCMWQSFGHRPTDETPHAFAAMRLLEKLATDPGIVSIMKERELVVGTLGEIDPIDDRLMQKKEQQGACLLGYNTNAGMRIDIKLRTDDLKTFRPYSQLAATLIHELSHNWVGEHNLLFWTNYGQMRAEYIHTHAARLRLQIVNGKTTADHAGIAAIGKKDVCATCTKELEVEMSQHGLHPRMIASAIQERCRELEKDQSGQRLGGDASETANDKKNSRDLALAAAEKRAKDSEKKR